MCVCVFESYTFGASAPWPEQKSLSPPGRSASFTQQDKDAGEDGDERPSAEADREDVGLGVAGHHRALLVAAAHVHGQRARAAQHRAPVVADQDGQVKCVLLVLSEARAPCQNPRCIV